MGVSVTLAIVSAASAEAMRSGPGLDACQQTETLSVDEQQVCANFHNMVEDAIRLDVDAVLEHFQPEGYSAALAGTLYRDYDSWAPVYRRDLGAVARIDHLEFPEVSVHTINTDTILLLNTYEETITLRSGEQVDLSGYGTQIWTRVGGVWRMIHIAGQ